LQLGSGGPSAVTLEETVCDAILPAGQWMAIGGRTDAISIKQIMSESCRERNFSGLAPLSDQHRQAMRALPGLVTRKGRRMKIQIFGWSFGQLQRQTWCVLHSWLDGLATVSARDQRCNQCHEKQNLICIPSVTTFCGELHRSAECPWTHRPAFHFVAHDPQFRILISHAGDGRRTLLFDRSLNRSCLHSS
jgi:hypothetical protein